MVDKFTFVVTNFAKHVVQTQAMWHAKWETCVADSGNVTRQIKIKSKTFLQHYTQQLFLASAFTDIKHLTRCCFVVKKNAMLFQSLTAYHSMLFYCIDIHVVWDLNNIFQHRFICYQHFSSFFNVWCKHAATLSKNHDMLFHQKIKICGWKIWNIKQPHVGPTIPRSHSVFLSSPPQFIVCSLNDI